MRRYLIMENEETNTAPELETVDGTFVDSVLDTLEIPEMTDEEADSKEAEQVEIEEEGGR